MDFNGPSSGDLAYSDAQDAKREVASLEARVTALSQDLATLTVMNTLLIQNVLAITLRVEKLEAGK